MSYEDDRMNEALVRAAYRSDSSLDRILRLADQGLSLTISLLVDGRWIEGALGRPEDWADKLDADIDAAFGGASARAAAEQGTITDPARLTSKTSSVGDVEELRARLWRASFRMAVDERRIAEAELAERVDALAEGELPPDDVQRDVDTAADPIPMITLRDAVIEGSTHALTRRRPMLRVMRSHVAAWHLGHSLEHPSR